MLCHTQRLKEARLLHASAITLRRQARCSVADYHPSTPAPATKRGTPPAGGERRGIGCNNEGQLVVKALLRAAEYSIGRDEMLRTDLIGALVRWPLFSPVKKSTSNHPPQNKPLIAPGSRIESQYAQ